MTHPSAAADAAWAASDFLAAAGRVVEGRRGGPLTEAAQTYDEAARELHGRVPAPTAAGTGLRVAGRLLMSAQIAQPSETRQLLALMAQLVALTDAVARLREAQARAGQAGAARKAAQSLRAATAPTTAASAVNATPTTSGGEARPTPSLAPSQPASNRQGPPAPRQ